MEQPPLETVVQRLERVEWENRRLKLLGAALGVVVGVLGLTCLGLLFARRDRSLLRRGPFTINVGSIRLRA